MNSNPPTNHLGIIGGNGFVGRNLIDVLLDQGIKVTVFPRETATSILELRKYLEILSSKELALEGVINASWAHTNRAGYRNDLDNYRWTEITINSYELLSGLGIPFVGFGTCLEKLDSPADEYTKSKVLVSDYFAGKKTKLDWTWLRLHYLYSMIPPRPRLIQEASDVHLKGEVMILKNMSARHDFIEVKDAAKLISNVVLNNHRGIRDIGSGHLKSNAELISDIFPNLRIESSEMPETQSGYQGLADIGYLH